MYNFFTRLRLAGVLSAKQLFQEITGIRQHLATDLEQQIGRGSRINNREYQAKDLTGLNHVLESNVPEEPKYVCEQNRPETGKEHYSDDLIAPMLH